MQLDVSNSYLAPYLRGEQPIISLPSGYLPSSSIDIVVMMKYQNTVSELFTGKCIRCTLNGGSSSAYFTEYMQNDNVVSSANWHIYCNFGYIAQPR